MAVNINRPFMNNTGLNEQNSLTNLIKYISPDMENETDIMNHSRYYNDTDFKAVLQQSNSEISILNLNCQMLGAKLNKLKLFLSDVDNNSNITCITVQETWFNEHTDLDFYTIPGYTLISNYCRISTHGGVAIYLHNDFSYELKSIHNTSLMFENISLEVWRSNSNDTKYLISSVYRPPTGLVDDLTTFTNDFTQFLSYVEERYRKAYICGDLNINLLLINENTYYNTFYENVVLHGFIPQITLPTRLSDTCDTLIDNIFTNNFDKNHINGVLCRKISDHQMTYCLLNTKTNNQRNNKIYIEVENINNNTLEKMRNELEQRNVYAQLDQSMQANPSDNCQILLNLLTEAKIKHIPIKIRKFNKRKDKKEKWMTNDLLAQINQKNDMYVDWKSKSATVDIYNEKKINFKTFERIIDKNIIEAKKQYYHNTFRNFKNNIKKTWITINETIGRHRKQTKMPTSVVYENKHTTDCNEIANAFNKYFINIGNDSSATIDGNTDDTSYKQYLQSPSELNCKLEKITEPEILIIMNKMENKSSSGYDTISNKILKFIKHEISKSITLIINQMLESGIFPDALKISKVIPLHKKDDVNSLSNYRPISLLPTLSKIFERVVYNQLYSYFVDNKLLSEQQYGFRSKHSTELAGIKLVDYLKAEIDKKQTPVNIYLDLSKAFDTINHDILLYKLEYYGIRGATLRLLKTYLTNRKQYVRYSTHSSTMMNIKNGVPQGSILGPLLFSIYINDLVNTSRKFKFIMYADDTTIYFNLEDFSLENRENEITNELNWVTIWLRENKLTLNADKTKCMIYHTWQKHITNTTFTMNGKQIERVKSFKFLGIILDENLTWRNHIDMVTNKLSKVIGILNRLKYVYPEQALLSIYNSLFISHVNYGLLLWGTKLDTIYKLQKKTIRIITGSAYLAHSEPIFKNYNLLNVLDLYKLKMLKFYYNLTYGLLPSYFNCYIDVIHKELPCAYELRKEFRPLIRIPRTRLVLAESSVLYQLILLINVTHENKPDILMKIDNKSHSYSGFSFNVTQLYLKDYKYECTQLMCYKCGRI